MNKIRRVCLYGGPNCSKSTTAAGIYFELKKLSVNIELASEWIKTWAYQNYKTKSYDQFYAYCKQLRKEDLLLNNGLDFLISDSPLLLNVAYSQKYNLDYWKHCYNISLEFEDKYPGLHIFLDRRDLFYNNLGRYEDLTEAVEMDENIKKLLDFSKLEYSIVKSTDFDKILSMVKNRLDIQPSIGVI